LAEPQGHGAQVELHRRPRAVAPGFRAHARDVFENGDRLVVLGEAEGEAWRPPYVQIWEFESGKAKRVATLTDTLAIAQALDDRHQVTV
jgi:ketosteroid isomerase-like protein